MFIILLSLNLWILCGLISKDIMVNRLLDISSSPLDSFDIFITNFIIFLGPTGLISVFITSFLFMIFKN